MTKFKTFFYSFYRSISSFSYYRDIVKTPKSFSYQYFFFMMFLLVVGMTVMIGIPITKEVPKLLTRGQEYARTLFPDDLQIEVKDGKLAINQPEPFVIPIPVELATDLPVAVSDQNRINLFTYTKDAQIDDFDTYQTLILANQSTIMVRSDQGDIRAYPIKEMENFTITKPLIDMLLNTITPYLKHVVPLMISVLFIVLLIFVPLFKLLSVLFLSIFTMVIGKAIMGLTLPYSKYVQIGLHAITLPLLVELILNLFNWQPPFVMFYSMFFILYIGIILSHLKTKE